MRVRVLGIGMGPGQVTGEVAAALADADYVVAARKRDADPLLDVQGLQQRRCRLCLQPRSDERDVDFQLA